MTEDQRTNRVLVTATIDDGREVVASVNRRGCKGPWTEKDSEMMREVLKVVHSQFGVKDTRSPPMTDAKELVPKVLTEEESR